MRLDTRLYRPPLRLGRTRPFLIIVPVRIHDARRAIQPPANASSPPAIAPPPDTLLDRRPPVARPDAERYSDFGVLEASELDGDAEPASPLPLLSGGA